MCLFLPLRGYIQLAAALLVVVTALPRNLLPVAHSHAAEVVAEEPNGAHGEPLSEHGEQHDAQQGEHAEEPHPEEDGEHHGEHHGSHSDHHHEEVTADQRSIAYILLFGLAAGMLLLLFLRYQKPDIRCSSAKMVCTAISVYCAVLLNQATFALIFDQLLVGKDGRGLGMDPEDVTPALRTVIGAVIFLLTMLSLNLVCWFFRRVPYILASASQLGAHVVAFSGICAFGSIQASKRFQETVISGGGLGDFVGEQFNPDHLVSVVYLTVTFVAFVFFVTIFFFSKVVRSFGSRRGQGRSRDYEQPPEHAAVWKWRADNGWQPHDEKTNEQLEKARKERKSKIVLKTTLGQLQVDLNEMKQRLYEQGSQPGKMRALRRQCERTEQEGWLEQMEEAEREAMALVLGFLTQQTVVHLITQKGSIPIHGLHSKRLLSEVLLMLLAAFASLGLLVGVSVCHRERSRSFLNFRGYLAMTMAWLFERASEWFMHHLFVNSLSMARVWSAFTMTGFSVVATLVVDVLADRTEDRSLREKKAKEVTLEELIALDTYIDSMQRPEEMGLTVGGYGITRLDDLAEELKDETVTDISAQTIITGFSVLVGITWDLAFESAEQLVVSPGEAAFPVSQSLLVDHPVIAKCTLALMLCSAVLPPWVLYIVPTAQKLWRHHLADVLLERRQAPAEHPSLLE